MNAAPTVAQTKSGLTAPRVAVMLAAWTVAMFLALGLAVFLHEDGHGVGAKLDGVHVSTGFNRIGNPGRAPADPDFRTGVMDGVWTGLLGPATSWVLAIVFTLWLSRFREPGRGAWMVGAFAVANALARAIPLARVLVFAALGQVALEDEVYWGLWYIGKVLRPDLGLAGVLALVPTQPGLLLAYPAIWITVLVSFGISLACLLVAYRHLAHLWRDLPARALFALAPLAAWYAVLPLLNVLDQVIRINW